MKLLKSSLDNAVLISFYSTRHRFITLFDDLRAEGNCRAPTENLAKSIEELRAGAVTWAVTPDLINHIKAHQKRWSSRLPYEYNQIARCLKLPPAKFIYDGRLVVTESEVRLQVSRQGKEIRELSSDCARLEAELAQDRPPILTTIKALFKRATW